MHSQPVRRRRGLCALRLRGLPNARPVTNRTPAVREKIAMESLVANTWYAPQPTATGTTSRPAPV
ncbi:hypothetical protein BN381_290165 [Candidatus Microthrix parvicella RN1]|uniref:Uncharacterized protein n=1 Tax=Candidatus Neomicrothrix parvicella RN1 TaxID=1229780 RepID=R4Z5I4_9ACTN|nr:hypothetical protein BN381_290165 [Candidatus Microthrix parvicella RN1]